MNILLVGGIDGNTGPSNVNKKIIDASRGNINYLKNKNKLFKYMELFMKILFTDIILYSGFSNTNLIIHKFCKLLNKKEIYLMHGCIKYENEINKLNMNSKLIKNEEIFINNVDMILTVSLNYKKWVQKYYENLSVPIEILYNGIELENRKKTSKRNIIALVGGNRNIKNNKLVCDIIDQINLKYKRNIQVYLFGRIYNDNENIRNNCVTIMGHLDKEKYYSELDKCKLFICDSLVESFNLSIVDAINCNCRLLIEKNVGISSILNLEENEIIYDKFDSVEIENKIINLIDKFEYKDNYIKNSEEYTWETEYKKLYKICFDLLKSSKDKKSSNYNKSL